MIVVPNSLIDKYNVPIPRYTSYPPANFFNEFTEEDYIKALEASNHDEPKNISIYIHIPFCSKICHYCGCNTQFTRNRDLDANVCGCPEKRNPNGKSKAGQ